MNLASDKRKARSYADYTPLYRISEKLSREGIKIHRKLLSQWAVHCGEALTPLYDEMVNTTAQLLKVTCG